MQKLLRSLLYFSLLLLAACAPVILTQPANQSVMAGQTATFSVVAGGTSPLSYQWYRNGNAISGATSASYTTPRTKIADNGDIFTVTISNAEGTLNSQEAILTVSPTRGFYLGSVYAHTVFTVSSATQFLTNLRNPDFVSVQAFDFTDTTYNTIDIWMTSNLLSAQDGFRAAQPNIKILVVVDSLATTPTDMANHALRANFVNTLVTYVNANGWDGAVIDIEPVADPSFDASQTWFIPLLQSLKTAMPHKLLVVFGQKLATPPKSKWNWTPAYLQSVAEIADYVEIGCYDTLIKTDLDYRTWLNGQISMVDGQGLSNIIFMMPAYPVNSSYPNHTSVENIGNCGALKNYNTDVFKQPTMTGDDYMMYYQLLGVNAATRK